MNFQIFVVYTSDTYTQLYLHNNIKVDLDCGVYYVHVDLVKVLLIADQD